MGGLATQVADNLFELGQSTVKAATQAGGDILSGTIEQLISTPNGGASQDDKSKNQKEMNREREAAESKQKDNQRYQQVKSELDRYRQRKEEQDRQIAQEKNQQEQEKQKQDAVAKQEKESFVQKMLRKVGAGSHGETAKQKE